MINGFMNALRWVGDLPDGGGFGILVVAVFVVISAGMAVNEIVKDRQRRR